MAEIKIKVCDRCGEKLKENRLLLQRQKKFKLFKTSPDPYGYWETQYELCKTCGDKLIDFIKVKE